MGQIYPLRGEACIILGYESADNRGRACFRFRTGARGLVLRRSFNRCEGRAALGMLPSRFRQPQTMEVRVESHHIQRIVATRSAVSTTDLDRLGFHCN
jgi:hypothetical protein